MDQNPAETSQTTRRSFVKLAAASALLASNSAKGAWAQSSADRVAPISDLPSLDGELAFDDVARQSAAMDWGFHLRRVPLAVLRPRSIDDIVRMVIYAVVWLVSAGFWSTTEHRCHNDARFEL